MSASSERQAALRKRELELNELEAKALEAYQEAGVRATVTFSNFTAISTSLDKTRKELNKEYERVKRAKTETNRLWAMYHDLKKENSEKIATLRAAANVEHQEMCLCFEQADKARRANNRALAPRYVTEARRHQRARNGLNDQVKSLIIEMREARATVEATASQADNSTFAALKAEFDQAKKAEDQAFTELEAVRSECEEKKAELYAIIKKHNEVKQELKDCLIQVAAEEHQVASKEATVRAPEVVARQTEATSSVTKQTKVTSSAARQAKVTLSATEQTGATSSATEQARATSSPLSDIIDYLREIFSL